MTNPPTRAGGCLMAAAILAGALIGLWAGEPSIGLVAGAGAAVLIGLWVWVSDRRR